MSCGQTDFHGCESFFHAISGALLQHFPPAWRRFRGALWLRISYESPAGDLARTGFMLSPYQIDSERKS
jgi:hypothetical protein